MKNILSTLIGIILSASLSFGQIAFPHNATNISGAERVANFGVNNLINQRFEITNATVNTNEYLPALWFHNGQTNYHATQFHATTTSAMDNGTNPLVKFIASVPTTVNLNAPAGTQFPWGNGGTQNPLAIRPTFSWSNGSNTVMQLSAQNYLGIGTTVPTAQLHTTGGVRFQGINNDNSQSRIMAQDVNGNVFWRDVNSIGGSSWDHIAIRNINMNGMAITNSLNTAPIASNPSNTIPGIRLDNNGNVRVGAAAPSPFLYLSGASTAEFPKLKVDGDLEASKGIFTSTGIADGANFSSWQARNDSCLVLAAGSLIGNGPGYKRTRMFCFSDFPASNLDPKSVAIFGIEDRNDMGRYRMVAETNGWTDFRIMNKSQQDLLKFYEDGNDNVTMTLPKLTSTFGLGTAAPTARLHTNGTVRFQDIQPNALTASELLTYTRILATDINGNVRWRDANTLSVGSTLINAGTNVTVTGSGVAGNPYVISSTGSTLINAGTNVTVTGNGSSTTPYVINSSNIYNSDGTLSANRTVNMNNNRLMFNTATNGRIYIGNTSNVSNNLNFPTTTGNYRLYVEGGILTERVKVALRSSSNWADYVFADDYKLTPLRDVEKFIKENKHLPNIESAETLSKEGLELGEMQAKQMAKIEELTLYAIEQNKQLEKQNKEIEELKSQVKSFLKRNN